MKFRRDVLETRSDRNLRLRSVTNQMNVRVAAWHKNVPISNIFFLSLLLWVLQQSDTPNKMSRVLSFESLCRYYSRTDSRSLLGLPDDMVSEMRGSHRQLKTCVVTAAVFMPLKCLGCGNVTFGDVQFCGDTLGKEKRQNSPKTVGVRACVRACVRVLNFSWLSSPASSRRCNHFFSK